MRWEFLDDSALNTNTRVFINRLRIIGGRGRHCARCIWSLQQLSCRMHSSSADKEIRPRGQGTCPQSQTGLRARSVRFRSPASLGASLQAGMISSLGLRSPWAPFTLLPRSSFKDCLHKEQASNWVKSKRALCTFSGYVCTRRDSYWWKKERVSLIIELIVGMTTSRACVTDIINELHGGQIVLGV